jgi:hypothetical protein
MSRDNKDLGASASPTALAGLRPEPVPVSAIRQPSTGAGFTPGPYAVRRTLNSAFQDAHWREIVAGDAERVIAEIYNGIGDDDPELTDAIAESNANLFAAAPCLYEALDEMQRLASDIPAINRNPRFPELRAKALRALSRARDETP